MSKTPEERIALAQWANTLMEDPNFKGVCNGIVADAMAGLLSASPGSDEAKQLHMDLLSANRFKNALQMLISDGSVARKQIEVRRNK